MSALHSRNVGGAFRLGYLDGTLLGNAEIAAHITAHADDLAILCLSVLTANYGASLKLAASAKAANRDVTTILGNDHFSALYERVLDRQPMIDFGFVGNDVVLGFAAFVSDTLSGRVGDLASYAGLAYRTPSGDVARNPENPLEYTRLPLIQYDLVDTAVPHKARYLAGQSRTYFFMRDRDLRSQVIDIGRGCVKFAGPRREGVPVNACDFCGIIPGTKAIVSPPAERAWLILESAFAQGYNYFYITADELPLTMWPMLRNMAANVPPWYCNLDPRDRPAMFGYARADGFARSPERIDVLVNQLGFDHFFIGFDGLTEVSLRVMNKQAAGPAGAATSAMAQNLRALDDMVQRGGMITAGIVLTHLGITPSIMRENFERLVEIVDAYPRTFAALDFGPLCPIPGSHTFRYLCEPAYARQQAEKFGLNVNLDYLGARQSHYESGDDFNMEDLHEDFIRGCCPDVTPALVSEYVERVKELAERHNIVVGGGV
jgi:hypothetical protein